MKQHAITAIRALCVVGCLLLNATPSSALLSATREVAGLCRAAETVDVTIYLRDALGENETRIESISVVDLLQDGWSAEHAEPAMDQGSQTSSVASWTQAGTAGGELLGEYYCEPSECDGQPDCQPQPCNSNAECGSIGGAPDAASRVCVGTGSIQYELRAPVTLADGNVAAVAGDIKFRRKTIDPQRPPAAETAVVAPATLGCTAASFRGERELSACAPPDDVSVTLRIFGDGSDSLDVFEAFPPGWQPVSISPFASEVRLADPDDPTSIEWVRWRLAPSAFVEGKAEITYAVAPLPNAEGGHAFRGGVTRAAVLSSFEQDRVLPIRGQTCAACPGSDAIVGCGDTDLGLNSDCVKYLKKQLKARSKCNDQLLASGPSVAGKCRSFELKKPTGCDVGAVVNATLSAAYGFNDQQKDAANAVGVAAATLGDQLKCQKLFAKAAVGFLTKRVAGIQKNCIDTFRDFRSCRDAQTGIAAKQLLAVTKCSGGQRVDTTNDRKVPDAGVPCDACIDSVGAIDATCLGACFRNLLTDMGDDLLASERE